MKIISIHTWMERIALRQPYAIAYQAIEDTELVFLEITLANGIVGYGASNPFAEVIGETPEKTLSLLQSEQAQYLIGRNIEDYRAIIHECYSIFPHYPGTQAAIDIALHDAFGKHINKPIVEIYGRKFTALPTSITIGIKSIDEMLHDANNFHKQGFRIFKLKTGINVDEDIERVIKLYALLGDNIKICVDANLGYDITALNRFLQAVKQVPVELIEQPVKVEESHLLNELPSTIKNKLVADESLTDLQSANKLVSGDNPFGVFNIKLMKAGGILAAKQIADLALSNKIKIFWGCNDESLVSITAALHIAYASEMTRYLDLDGSLEVMENLFKGGFTLKDGIMHLTGGSGLGVTKVS